MASIIKYWFYWLNRDKTKQEPLFEFGLRPQGKLGLPDILLEDMCLENCTTHAKRRNI